MTEKHDIETIEKVYRVTIANDLRKRNARTKCYYADCNCEPIKSHSIQEALLQNSIGKSGYVYTSNINSTASNIVNENTSVFSCMPITQAGVFQGFCGENKGESHDTKLFKLIEIDNEVEKTSKEKYVFIYAYRALIYQLWLESTLSSSMEESSLTKAKKNPLINMDKLGAIHSSARIETATPESIQEYENLKLIFEKYITGSGTVYGDIGKSFNIGIVELANYKLEFAGIGSKILNSKYPICYGLIPAKSNKSNLFFWVSERSDKCIHDFIEFIVKNHEINSIQNLVALSGNMMLSEDLFNKLQSTQELSKLESFINFSNRGTNYDQYDLIKGHGYNLF